MKLRFLIPSLLAAGFLPAHATAIAAAPREEDGVKNVPLFDVFKRVHKYNLAAHRSHSSHASHGSHRSSGGGGSYRPPSATPPPSRNFNSTPPSSILPSVPAAPKTLPGNTAKFVAIIAELQTCLSLFNYYGGAIDGVMGPETATAISKFQAQWGHPITGTVTPQVLDACGITVK